MEKNASQSIEWAIIEPSAVGSEYFEWIKLIERLICHSMEAFVDLIYVKGKGQDNGKENNNNPCDSNFMANDPKCVNSKVWD